MGKKPCVPKVLDFFCEKCRGVHSADYVREHKGNCGCGGDSWTLMIGYTRAHRSFSPEHLALEIMGRTIFGNKEWESGATSDEIQKYEYVFPEVTAADALTICKVRYREEYRVLEYIKYRKQRDAEEKLAALGPGAQSCAECGTPFLADNEIWMQSGYCSKACFSHGFAKFNGKRDENTPR